MYSSQAPRLIRPPFRSSRDGPPPSTRWARTISLPWVDVPGDHIALSQFALDHLPVRRPRQAPLEPELLGDLVSRQLLAQEALKIGGAHWVARPHHPHRNPTP